MTRIQGEIIGRMDEGRGKEKVIKFASESFIMAQEWGNPNNLSTSASGRIHPHSTVPGRPQGELVCE